MEIIDTEYFDLPRKIVSNMTSESWETIPHGSFTYRAKAEKLLSVLKEINSGIAPEEKITLNTAMLRIITEALVACPKMNGHIHFNRRLVRGKVEFMRNVDISMPVLLKSGVMMTLNMHDFQDKTMSQMRDAINDSIARAENSDLKKALMSVSMDNTIKGLMRGKLLQTLGRLLGILLDKFNPAAPKETKVRPVGSSLAVRDMEQGTITVSNVGPLYMNWPGECTLLEIIPPQLSAICIGNIQKLPYVNENDEICAGRFIPLTIAFDHRALDFGDVVPFLKKLDEIFDEPSVLRDWL